MRKRLLTVLTRYWHYLVNFGPRLTFYYLTYPRFVGRKAIFKRHDEIKRYLKKQLAPILEKYQGCAVDVNKTVVADSPIWVCWLHGEGNMPPIAQACYRSVLKFAGNRPVNQLFTALRGEKS